MYSIVRLPAQLPQAKQKVLPLQSVIGWLPVRANKGQPESDEASCLTPKDNSQVLVGIMALSLGHGASHFRVAELSCDWAETPNASLVEYFEVRGNDGSTSMALILFMINHQSDLVQQGYYRFISINYNAFSCSALL